MKEGTTHVESLDAQHELQVADPSGLEIPYEPSSTARKMTLNMGPQHPSTHGVLRVVLELDGETILTARPEVGFLHTGIEKQFEERLDQEKQIQTTQYQDTIKQLKDTLNAMIVPVQNATAVQTINTEIKK